jgi:hypothetical protein
MICWQCLTAVDWTIAPGDCHVCGAEKSDSDVFRADRFMALVAALSARDGYDPGEAVVHDALFTMREIERRVEAGELFWRSGREEGA